MFAIMGWALGSFTGRGFVNCVYWTMSHKDSNVRIYVHRTLHLRAETECISCSRENSG